jgi:hypothetical protein
MKAHGMFFFKTEYDKVRDQVKSMNQELLARFENEWRQQCESARVVSSFHFVAPVASNVVQPERAGLQDLVGQQTAEEKG